LERKGREGREENTVFLCVLCGLCVRSWVRSTDQPAHGPGAGTGFSASSCSSSHWWAWSV